MKVNLPFPTFNVSIESPSGKTYIIQNMLAIPVAGDSVMVGGLGTEVEHGYVTSRRFWDLTGDEDIYAVHIRLTNIATPIETE